MRRPEDVSLTEVIALAAFEGIAEQVRTNGFPVRAMR